MEGSLSVSVNSDEMRFTFSQRSHCQSNGDLSVESPANLRILIADDTPKSLQILAAIVGGVFEVVATAPDGTSALQLIRELKPDIAVLDFEMPGMSGIEVTRELMKDGHRLRVVICSVYRTTELIEEARRAGASAYVFKDCCARDLLTAITVVERGQTFFPVHSRSNC